MKPHLISFKICPFVQRSLIMLREKGIDYEISYINPKQPPDWFTAISPLGKVPLLKVGDQVLFESAVIMEYLDEVNPPSLHPAEPLQKAQNRAWIEFASTLLMNQFAMVTAKEQEGFEQAQGELQGKLVQLERQLTGPFFNGEAFALVDVAFAPLFMRLGYLESWHPLGLLDRLPKVAAWSAALLERESVKGSVVEELPQLYRGFITASGGVGAALFSA